MNPYVKKTISCRNRGFNCCQSVACAFSEEIGLPEESLHRLTEGLGGGIAGRGELCGAASAMVLIAGIMIGSGPDKPVSKQETYRVARELLEAFRAEVGSLDCTEIKMGDGNEPLCTCSKCMESAAQIVAEHFFPDADGNADFPG